MTSAPSSAAKIWGALRPILPWALGLALLLMLAGLYAPQRFMSWLSWQLYFDRLSPSFHPPLGFEGRAILSLGASAIVFLLSLSVGLLLPKGAKRITAAKAQDAPSWGFSGADNSILDETSAPRQHFGSFLDDPIPQRNLADAHPDDAPRPPLRAGSELPAGGLGPMKRPAPVGHGLQASTAEAIGALDPAVFELPESAQQAEKSADFANDAADVAQSETQPATQPSAATPAPQPSIAEAKPEADPIIAGQEPWLQAGQPLSPSKLAAKDLSLSAMVARLEAGLSSRRRAIEPPMAPPAIPVPDVASASSVEDHKVDVALEAALGTLKRMNMRAVG